MARVLLACVLWVVMGSSIAQTFACQYVASAGLHWTNGSWEIARFKVDEPFFLKMALDGKNLDADSIFKIVGTVSTCVTNTRNQIMCMGAKEGFVGTRVSLVFDPQAMRGGKSELLGSLNAEMNKDSMSVNQFVCQKIK